MYVRYLSEPFTPAMPINNGQLTLLLDFLEAGAVDDAQQDDQVGACQAGEVTGQAVVHFLVVPQCNSSVWKSVRGPHTVG